MKARLHPERATSRLDTAGYLVDIGMIILVIVNLGLILFDWLFQIPQVQATLQSYTPAFHDAYNDTIHSNFLFYDLCFVAIYLSEFAVRWIVAIARNTYHRWFFFPFIHWYDLLGCIPVGSFRWLRILRVASLLIRLQRRGIIDLSQTYLGQTLLKYYRIVVEEISDRVVINVLSGAQKEIASGSPLMHRIEQEVLKPRQDKLVGFAADRLAHAVQHSHQQFREQLADYFQHLTDEAVLRTPSGRRLAAVPLAGPRVIALLDEAVREVGSALVDQLAEDIGSPANREQLKTLINELIAAASGDSEVLNSLLQETINDVLEQVKQQVSVKQWQQEYE